MNEAERREGRVVFRSSREILVRVDEVARPVGPTSESPTKNTEEFTAPDAQEWRCELRGILKRKKQIAVVGDRVIVTPTGDDRGVVEEILPRKNYLSRRREVGGGRQLIVASNLDQVIAVFAVRRPRLKFGALDRLLVAAEHHGLPALIVVNKIDLGVEPELEVELANYQSIGYRVMRLSATGDEALDEFADILRGRVSVVSGPSGVGKSSLLSRVLGVEIRVGEVSRHNEKGRHTTTAASGYGVPGGGAVIDTPGFRDYGLWDMEPTELARAMPDLAPHLADCRFSDCLHRGEPNCGVVAAAEAGAIHPRRLKSYRGILDTLIELDAGN